MAKLRKTVLIVDDEAASRALLREILVGGGFDVLEAADGLEALQLLEQRAIHLALIDRAMPGMGGLELLTKMREKEIKTPALVVSAYGEESFWGQAIGLGAVDYLVKTFEPAQVLKSVQKALKGTKSS